MKSAPNNQDMNDEVVTKDELQEIQRFIDEQKKFSDWSIRRRRKVDKYEQPIAQGVKVGDILLQELNMNIRLMWQVESVQLGSTQQESVVELRPIDRTKADVSDLGVINSYVPAQMLDKAIATQIVRIIFRGG